MPTKFTRETYRAGYLKARELYDKTKSPFHPWNKMAMRMKASDRKMWLVGSKWEQEQ